MTSRNTTMSSLRACMTVPTVLWSTVVSLWGRKEGACGFGLDTTHLKSMAGSFSRRIHAYAKKKAIPLYPGRPKA